MISCCLRQILTLPCECHSRNRDSSDQAKFFQSSMVQFWWARANCSLSFLFVADRSWQNPVWSSAVVAHLLQGSTCCAFRDALLHTSGINKAISPSEVPLTGYFLFFRPFSVSLEMVVRENPSRSAVSEILRPACLAPTTRPCSKTLKSPFFPILMFGNNHRLYTCMYSYEKWNDA